MILHRQHACYVFGSTTSLCHVATTEEKLTKNLKKISYFILSGSGGATTNLKPKRDILEQYFVQPSTTLDYQKKRKKLHAIPSVLAL